VSRPAQLRHLQCPPRSRARRRFRCCCNRPATLCAARHPARFRTWEQRGNNNAQTPGNTKGRADQKAGRNNRKYVPALSAKPPSPVQIRAAPPTLTVRRSTTCVGRCVRRRRQLGTTWEQLAFECPDRLPVRCVDDVRVDVERRRDARVPELLLRDLHGHSQVVEQRRMNVAKLVPRHSPQPRAYCLRLQDLPQDLGFT
jgi:hypothetical protein